MMENMARRATIQWWRTMGGQRSAGFATSPKVKEFASKTADATSPKVKQFASKTVDAAKKEGKSFKLELKADYAPIYIVCGFVGLAICFAIHTAKQNLVHGPAVQVNKGRRTAGVPEVDYPDDIVRHADKFINNSFLRKIGHIQEKDPAHLPPNPINPFTRSREVESLKTVGALPSQKK